MLSKIEAKATNNCLDTSDICELLGVTKATVYGYRNPAGKPTALAVG